MRAQAAAQIWDRIGRGATLQSKCPLCGERHSLSKCPRWTNQRKVNHHG